MRTSRRMDGWRSEGEGRGRGLTEEVDKEEYDALAFAFLLGLVLNVFNVVFIKDSHQFNVS